MHARFKTLYTNTPCLVGIDFTSNWLMEVEEKTGRSEKAKELIKEEMERIQPELNKLKGKLAGKRVIIANSHSKRIGLVQVCYNLGMEVIGAYSHFTDDSLIEGKKKILSQVGDISVRVDSPLYEEKCQIIKEKPDIV